MLLLKEMRYDADKFKKLINSTEQLTHVRSDRNKVHCGLPISIKLKLPSLASRKQPPKQNSALPLLDTLLSTSPDKHKPKYEGQISPGVQSYQCDVAIERHTREAGLAVV